LSAISPSSLTYARRPLVDVRSRLSLRPGPPLPNSSRITSFADPHPLNSIESYRSKIIGGRACAISPFRRSSIFRHIPFSFKPLRTLLHSFALSCTRAKLNSFVFSQLRTLCPKTRGGASSEGRPLHPYPLFSPYPFSMLLYIVTSLLLSFPHD
jgi:hypothetical protein